VRDLVLLSRHMLKPHGRLVFFLPTVAEEYSDVDVQTMVCEGMEVIANSLQDFGSWGRRVSFFFILWKRFLYGVKSW
jgi:tRNA (guanine10-N2)-methyltransferase